MEWAVGCYAAASLSLLLHNTWLCAFDILLWLCTILCFTAIVVVKNLSYKKVAVQAQEVWSPPKVSFHFSNTFDETETTQSIHRGFTLSAEREAKANGMNGLAGKQNEPSDRVTLLFLTWQPLLFH